MVAAQERIAEYRILKSAPNSTVYRQRLEELRDEFLAAQHAFHQACSPMAVMDRLDELEEMMRKLLAELRIANTNRIQLGN